MSWRGLLGAAATRQAAPPVPFASKWRNPFSTQGLSGNAKLSKQDELERYSATGTLFGIVSKLASTTSLVNWRLYKSAASGLEEDRTEITNTYGRQNPALKLLKRPNAYMPWQEFCETFQQHIDLTGEAYWLIVKVGNVPVEMWPVRPDRMYPVPSVADFIAGYIYTSPDGENIPLLPDQVIMLRWPAPLDIYAGHSPLPALSYDIDNERAQSQWSESFYRNSALPGGVLQVGTRLGEDEFLELVDRWNRQHRGVQNAGRVAVLEQGTFTPLAYTQKDMQFVEMRQFTKQAILDAYGFPKFGLGDVEDVNRASADASKSYMAESLNIPRLERIKAAVNFELLPMFGLPGQEYDYDSPVSDDQEIINAALTAKTTALVALAQAGFDTDEASDAIDFPRIAYKRPAPAPIMAPHPGFGQPDQPAPGVAPDESQQRQGGEQDAPEPAAT